MIIKKTATLLLSGTALSLAMATAPLHAQNDGETATEAMAAEAEENLEAAGEAMEEGAEEMKAEVEGLDDMDETAMMIQDQIAEHPQLGVYQLEVRKMDGMEDAYEVTGMIDKSEDYETLQMALDDIEGVDASQITNSVVVQ